MSTFNDFLEERDKIDFLIEKGYAIKKVTETLDGSHLEFEKKGETDEILRETLQVENADARKYFATLIINERKP